MIKCKQSDKQAGDKPVAEVWWGDRARTSRVRNVIITHNNRIYLYRSNIGTLDVDNNV